MQSNSADARVRMHEGHDTRARIGTSDNGQVARSPRGTGPGAGTGAGTGPGTRFYFDSKFSQIGQIRGGLVDSFAHLPAPVLCDNPEASLAHRYG